MTATFKDHFSEQSDNYAKYRPHYPSALFEYLAGLTENHHRALDVATGSGQSAIALAPFFDSVIAIDASRAQIAAAEQHPSVTYKVARAESTGLDDASIDLLTVAQAMHWFDAKAFFADACRILRDSGVLAIWLYELTEIDSACDAIVDRLYRDIVGPFWPAERVQIENAYANVRMPGTSVDTPTFQMTASWSVDTMLGYLRTWSATKRYKEQHGSDPVEQIQADLCSAWGKAEKRVSWPLVLKVCRPHKPVRMLASNSM